MVATAIVLQPPLPTPVERLQTKYLLFRLGAVYWKLDIHSILELLQREERIRIYKDSTANIFLVFKNQLS